MAAAVRDLRRAEPAGLIGDGDFAFQVGDNLVEGLRLQGEADLEYLFLPHVAGRPLPAETIASTATLLPQIDALAAEPDLADALSYLLATTVPTLGVAVQLTLAVIALEALLLPEVYSGLAKTFRRAPA